MITVLQGGAPNPRSLLIFQCHYRRNCAGGVHARSTGSSQARWIMILREGKLEQKIKLAEALCWYCGIDDRTTAGKRRWLGIEPYHHISCLKD